MALASGSIVPPPSWKPPFVLDRNKLKFPTRVQKINELMARAAHPSIGALPARASIGELLTAGPLFGVQVRKVHRMQFMKSLTEFWDKAGSPLTKIPVIGGTELNLHLLHTTVAKLGGYERVCAERRWMEVRRAARATLALTATLTLTATLALTATATRAPTTPSLAPTPRHAPTPKPGLGR